MYKEFFGLTTEPFALRPDPAFLYWSAQHSAASNLLDYAVESLTPIVLITGEIGCGKSTLLQDLTGKLPEDVTVGLISNYSQALGSIYQSILLAFGQDFQIEDEAGQVEALHKFIIDEYARGRRTMLILDEAQNAGPDALEQLRLLTNINQARDVLFMLILCGQPELREQLAGSEFRNMRQRIGCAFHLRTLSAEDTAEYIRHRLTVAGAEAEIFTPAAIDAVWRLSAGVPRVINTVCNLALVLAFGDGRKVIDAAFMQEVAESASEQGLAVQDLPAPRPAPAVPSPLVSAPPVSAPVVVPLHPGRAVGRGRAAVALAQPVVLPEPDQEAEETPDAARLAPEPSQPDDAAQPAAAAGDAADAGDEVPLVLPPPVAVTLAETAQEAPATARPAAATSTPPRRRIWPWVAGLAVAGLGGGFMLLPDWRQQAAALWPATEPADQIALASAPAAAPDSATAAAPVSAANPSEAAPAVEPQVEPQVAPQAGPVMAAPSPYRASFDLAPDAGVPPDAAALLDQGLERSFDAPEVAALIYARAALAGNMRAAYYLGQLYDTGDGVPYNPALARVWYDAASATERGAARRLADMPEPAAAAQPVTPVPQFGWSGPDGQIALIWTAPYAGGTQQFRVELGGAQGEVLAQADTGLTALTLPRAPEARLWRVVGATPGGAEAPSGWLELP